MSALLVRVIAPHFVAGLIIRDDRCIEAAPILRRDCVGQAADELRALFVRKGWKATVRPDPGVR